MDLIGIVAEYNPFHCGHAYHLQQSRERLGDDCGVICVMSGDFVQRGDIALYSKYARAEAACRCGADLVVELPAPWALSSAETFAAASVDLLASLGVNHISFGSEAGEIDRLNRLAGYLNEKETYEAIKERLRSSPQLSFAAARQKVLQDRIGGEAALLETPNNILAVEYLRALRKYGDRIKPMTISRIGSGHDCMGNDGPKSASELRRMRAQGAEIASLVPASAEEIYCRERLQGREVADRMRFELAVVSRLQMLPEESFHQLPDASDGAGARLYAAVQKHLSLNDICMAAKTKRYALSRIRRMVMCAALKIGKEMAGHAIPYARILAANEKGCKIIRTLGEKNSIPFISKPSHVNLLSDFSRDVFATGVLAQDLFALSCAGEDSKKAGNEWRNSPKIVKNI